MLSIGAVLLLFSPSMTACGCPAVDMSRAIVLKPVASTLDLASSDAGLSASEVSEAAAAIESATRLVVAGYWHNPSCHTKPWHEADFAAYYSSDSSSINVHSNVSLEGDYAVDRISRTAGIGELSELELTGTFRIDTTQNALDQQFPPHDKGKHIFVEEQERVQVPIIWQAQGAINGREFSTTFVALCVVDLF